MPIDIIVPMNQPENGDRFYRFTGSVKVIAEYLPHMPWDEQGDALVMGVSDIRPYLIGGLSADPQEEIGLIIMPK